MNDTREEPILCINFFNAKFSNFTDTGASVLDMSKKL